MVEYLYMHMVPSALNRFQKGPNHLRGLDKLIPEGDPTIPDVRGQTKLTPDVGPEGDQ